MRNTQIFIKREKSEAQTATQTNRPGANTSLPSTTKGHHSLSLTHARENKIDNLSGNGLDLLSIALRQEREFIQCFVPYSLNVF